MQAAIAAAPAALQAFQVAKGAHDLMSPQGPLVQGDIFGAVQSGMDLFGGIKGLGAKSLSPLVSAPLGATVSSSGPRIGSKEILGNATFGSFSSLPSDIQKEVLSILTR